MTNWILHVDLDQFIAAVELLRRPELRGLPVVVGGDGDPGKRGVVATASYEAREYGVHSGLPMRTAVRRCPEAVFLPVDREAYDAASEQVMSSLRELGHVTEVLGWDEAFVAVDTGDPEAVARQISERIRAGTQLHCSVGIGENRIQAKTATSFAKPAGVFRLTHQNWFSVMGGLPARRAAGASAPRPSTSWPNWASKPCPTWPRPTSGWWQPGSGRRSGRGWCRPPAASARPR